MNTQFDYLLNTLFIAGLVFLLTYIALILYEHRLLQRYSYKNLIGGALFGLAITLVMLFLNYKGLNMMPDGRFLVIGLSAYLWGIFPGSLTAIIIVLTSFLLHNSSVPYDSATAIIQVLLFGMVRKFYGNRLSPLRLTLLGLITPILYITIAAIALRGRPEVNTAIQNIPALIFFTLLLMASLTFAIFRELDRSAHLEILQEANDNLKTQNDEIQALYEEMAASEEALQENYDELSRFHDKLAESDERYQLVLLASEEGFWDYRPSEGRIEVSDSFCKIFGIAHCENPFLLHQLLHKIHVDDRQKLNWLFYSDFSLMQTKPVFACEVRAILPTNIYRWVSMKAFAQTDSNGRVLRITGSVVDIHDRVLQQEKLSHYAFHDPLTGFFNRDHLHELIASALKNPESAETNSLLIISIRGMDRYLNTLGKVRSDILHYQVGLILQEACSSYDFDAIHTLAEGRFGLLLRNTWEKIAMEKMVINLKTRLKTPVQLQSMDLHVALAFGALAFSEITVQKDAESLLTYCEATADHALSLSKGPLIQWYNHDMDKERQYIGKTELYLTHAIEQNQLSMVYQPQFDSDHKVIGFEALLRWHHPELGSVPPSFFIPLAEKSGYIETLGEFILEQACSFASSYTKIFDVSPKIAINASFLELMNPHYADRVDHCLAKYHLQPSNLIIEITETAISAFIDDVVDHLNQLRQRGYEVHLDDFGTGYSSLSHLGRLPVSTLKIDRAFISTMESDHHMMSLTQLIVEIAKKLELDVIAEGVETKSQRDLLAEMGCHYYQGYYFSKPLTPEAILNAPNNFQ